ncbi:MAG: AIR synthase-related protein [candidate division WOR-3 bacterium]
MRLKTGKLPPEVLTKILKGLPCNSVDVIIGPRYGVDGAILNVGRKRFAFTSDPITFTSKESVYYLFSVNINDTISMGAKPEFFAINLLFREGITLEEVESIFIELSQYALMYDICIITGHTEVTPGLKSNVLSGFMFGSVLREVGPEKIKERDVIVQIKGVAIEGTAILAREKENELLTKFDHEFVHRCKNFLFDPGICLHKVGLEVLEKFSVHSLHDPTEGGIQTAVYEVLKAANMGAEIFEKEFLIYEETKEISKFFKINPLGLISSGCLLAILDEQEGVELCEYFNNLGIPAKIVGRVLGHEREIFLIKDGKKEELTPFERDQILEVL